jgi:DNA helicase-2/ATP-dependent DNA helicase PcrA
MDREQLLVDLDPDQRRAVTTESRLVAVVAGAGSGKTRVLTRRVAYRIADGTADEAHTLVLTFTRQAAGELRRRLPRLGASGGRVTTGTFHAIALSLLQQRWRDRDQRPLSVADDRRRIITRLAGDGERGDRIADEIEWASARGMSPAAYESAVRNGDRRPPIDADQVVELFGRYRDDKRRRQVVDLDDLLSLTIAAIETDHDFADALRWRFRHVLVDEAQDLNPLQHRLVDLLRFGHDDLYLVGDPAQAIFGFNGADPGLLVDVATRFPGIEIVRLPVNHRCTPQIVQAGVHVLGSEAGGLRSARDDGARVEVIEHADEHEESSWIARAIVGLDPALVRGNEVAVLARTNAQLPAIERSLTAAGIAVRHSLHSKGSPIRTALLEAFRSGDAHQLRRWAHDTIEVGGGDDSDASGEASLRVAHLTLEFLRAQPNGDGGDFRSWVDANDPFGQRTAGVELLTFHAAKGREWHTVVLAGCETSLVPHRSATTNAARAEETRLLYVAITRASDRAIVSWARRRGGYQRRLTPLLDGFVSDGPQVIAPPPQLVRRQRSARDLLLERLHVWRADAARAGGIVPEAVCSDAALAIIADHPPTSPEQLDELTQFGLLTSRRLYPAIADAIEPSSRNCASDHGL